MDILKKLVPPIAVTGGIAGILKLSSSGLASEGINPKDLEQMFQLTKNLSDVRLNSSLDPNINSISTDTQFLYSLFSTNLKTFSKHFQTYFQKWFLYQWSQWMLQNTEPGSFSGIKDSINKVLDKITFDPTWSPNGTPFDSEHWTKTYNSITSSHQELHNLFVDFFFNEVWKNSSGEDISQEDSQLAKYGDIQKAKSMVSFQKFVFDQWIITQKPHLLCTKSWSYDSSFTKPLYKNSHDGKHRPDSPNFSFPSYYSIKDDVVEWTKKGQCETTLFTLSDLSKMEGREIDAFLTKYHKDINNDTADPITDKGEHHDNVHDIFYIDNQPSNQSVSKASSDLIDTTDTSNPIKDASGKYWVPLRDVKFGDDARKTTFVRTTKGLTSLYWDASKNKDTELRKELLKNNKLSENLKTFFSENFTSLIGKFVGDIQYITERSIFGFQSPESPIYKLVKAFADFHSEFTKNSTQWDLMTKMSQAVTLYSQATFKSSTPGFETGLANPLHSLRNLDNEKSIINKQQDKDFISQISESNNGLYPKLYKYLDKDWKTTTLNTHAKALRNSISSYFKSILDPKSFRIDSVSEYGRYGYVLGDYIFDNVYFQFLKEEDGNFIKRATKSLILVNHINFNPFTYGLDSFVSHWIQSLGVTTSSCIKQSTLSAIKGIYYGSRYLSETTEHQLNYGGFKYSKPTQETIRKYSIDQAPSKSSSTNDCSVPDTQQEWETKMSDYWVQKNYIFGQGGYELADSSTIDHLSFLYTFTQFGQNKFHKLRSQIQSLIPEGRYGALVWMDNLLDMSKANQEGQADNNSLKDIKKYFKSTNFEDLFNPFYNGSLKVEDKDNHTFSTDWLGAFAKTGDSEYTELFGFQGFFSDSFNSQKLPKPVNEAIFQKFQMSNPKENKNYTANSNSSDISSGSAFGYFFSDSKRPINERIDSLATQGNLKTFLKYTFSDSIADEVWKDVNDDNPKTLQELKKLAKEKLSDSSHTEQVKKATTRFSGFLQNPGKEDSQYKSSPFLIPDSDNKKANLVYITQVNKHDLGVGFADFVRVIGIDTFIRTVVKLSSDPEMYNKNVSNLLSYKGVIW